MSKKQKKATTFHRSVIVVASEEDRKALVKASEYLHDLTEIDTDIPMVNWLCHIYESPHTSIVVLKGSVGT